VVPWPRLYSGDGHYSRNGTYRVKLGSVDLDRPGTTTFRIANLGPAWDWNVGFRIEPRPESVVDLYLPGTTRLRPELVPRSEVTLELITGETVVFSARGPLDSWSWTWNHAAKSGTGEEYQSDPTTYRYRRLGIGPHRGWGSHFTPRFGSEYTLRVTVERAEPVDQSTHAWVVVESYWALP
jgi:hypothetical protein